MAWTFASLVTEVQARTHQATAGSSELIGATRVGTWVNWAIRTIVRKFPGLRDVDRLDKTTIKLQDGVWEYDLDAFKNQGYEIAHILKLKLIDKTHADYGVIEPYVGGLDQWDTDYPYIPNVDETGGCPRFYVRRGNTLEICPMPSSNQDGAPLWVHFSYLPTDIASTDYPVLTDFDEPIVNLAMVPAFRSLKKYQEANDQLQYALGLTQERVEDEGDWDTTDAIAYNGP